MVKHIHFIVNPIAGPGRNLLTAEVLKHYFDGEPYNLKVKHTNYRRHATYLTRESIKEGATIIVACGGDGTVNEVASCLVGSKIRLGIIPIGSGNGLASTLQIPGSLKRAISIIKKDKGTKIDVGQINGRYFFSNMGIGFDASVIRNYEASKKRTLTGYIRASLVALREVHRMKDIEIEIDSLNAVINPFMIFVSNSNEMGYNMSLTPKASLHDGMLDVLVIPRIGKLKMIILGLLMLLRKPYLFKNSKSFQTKHLQLQRIKGESLESQIDGEFHKIENKELDISILEKSLQVLV